MIKGMMKILAMAGSFLPKWIIMTTLIWAVAFLVCYIMGGIALWRMGSRGGYKKRGLGWVPGVQIYCEAAFSAKPHTARRIQICLWWFLVAVAAAATAGVWYAAGVLGAEGIPMGFLKIAMIALVVIALILCFLIRADELTCLRKVFQNDLLWWLSIAGSIICLPLQRIFLFSLSQEEEE